MYTPGPWRFNEWGEIEAENECVVANIPHIDKRIRGKERREEHEYRNGNGRLIAAAPRMYEALERICRESADESSRMEARAAIAQATETT